MNNSNISKNNLNVSIKSIKSIGSKKGNSNNNLSPNKLNSTINNKDDYYERNFSSIDFWSEYYKTINYETYDCVLLYWHPVS